MGPTIVVIAAGEMGAAIGQRLHLRGATVRTTLKGRSAATIERSARGIAVSGSLASPAVTATTSVPM